MMFIYFCQKLLPQFVNSNQRLWLWFRRVLAAYERGRNAKHFSEVSNILPGFLDVFWFYFTQLFVQTSAEL